MLKLYSLISDEAMLCYDCELIPALSSCKARLIARRFAKLAF